MVAQALTATAFLALIAFAIVAWREAKQPGDRGARVSATLAALGFIAAAAVVGVAVIS
jgi:hypothetical protein